MLNIFALPAFQDNYIWLIQDAASRQCAVVDPGDATPVLAWLAQNPEWQLITVLITHHHRDHTGGIEPLKQQTGAQVYGPALEAINGLDHPLQDGQVLELFGHTLEVLHVPGHTAGHIAYACRGPVPFLFCGDTLFAAGCGRLFEGTAEQMYQSLERMAQLPDATAVYCTHEYTLSNLAFACAVEPDNLRLHERQAEVSTLRAQQRISLPSSLQLERATNPFLRCSQDSVRQSAARYAGQELATPVQVFAALRAWKDNF